MFGDVLRKNISRLSHCSTKKTASNAFWIILRDIAIEEIKKAYPEKIDSDIAIGVYYEILSEYEDLLPSYFRETLESNHQERYRVINRNLWSSNAFHSDGLANQPGIKAYTEPNEDKKGSRIVYIGGEL